MGDYKDLENVEDAWVKYEGDFKNDAKDGIGKLYLTNGEIYEGEFMDDRVHGKGKFFRKNGGIIVGEWFENKIVRIL